jgi:hypothetical protein
MNDNDIKLGKITSIKFGVCEGRLGLHVEFGGPFGGVGWRFTTWDPTKIKKSKHAVWTEKERSKFHDELVRLISKFLDEAKVNSVEELKDTPVELVFDNNTLKSWRILTEVL